MNSGYGGVVPIGFGNIVFAARIIAVVNPDAAPIKRMVQVAREAGRTVDATHGRRIRAVIVMDDGHIVLSSIQPETIAGRVNQNG